MKPLPKQSAISLFFELCDSQRTVRYSDVKDLAEKCDVKIETLTRRTRAGDRIVSGLRFKKFNAKGKLIKGSQRWYTMKILGRYRTQTILNK